MVEYLGIILICCGLAIMTISIIGILLLPNFYTRMHPAGMAESLGVPTVFLGFVLALGLYNMLPKLAMLVLLLWIGSTIASYILASSFYYKNNVEKYK